MKSCFRPIAVAGALLAAATAMLITSGCGGGSGRSAFSDEDVWSMPPSEVAIPAPRSLCVATNGELYVLDTIGRVIVYGSDGNVARIWSMPETSVGRPEGVVELSDGSILVADTHYHRLVRFSKSGEVLSMWGSKGEGDGEFIYPVAVEQGPDGSIYVAEYGGNDRIQVFTSKGEFIRAFGSFGTGEKQFQRCSGLAFLDGRLYVADAINNRIQVYTPEGEQVACYNETGGEMYRYPYDISVTAEGNLAVIEYSAGCVSVIDAEGNTLGRYGTTGRGSGNFATPWGIAAGIDGCLFIADTGNHRIVKVRL